LAIELGYSSLSIPYDIIAVAKNLTLFSLATSFALLRATSILGIKAPAKIHKNTNAQSTSLTAEMIVPANAARLSCFLFKAMIPKINQRILNPTNDKTKLAIANHCFGSS
jgi:hypothetical protein